MERTDYLEIDGNSRGYYGLFGLLGLLVVIGLGAAYYMEHHGHYVTGMTNQIIWGTPHIFAVFLIVAASGALNVASIASVFGRTFYKPLSRLSGLLALALLTGGLAILVLDLGRPDRLIVAMTTYNFKSIFAWNIFLYTGFMAIVIVYLWMMMERRMNAYSKPVGLVAFVWRLVLTTGTGSIFGFLVARQAYDTAIMAPMFIAMSFSYGLAIFILVLMVSYWGTGRPLGDVLLRRLKNLLGVFVAAVFYFVLAYHVTNLYMTELHGVQSFILTSGGPFTVAFWLGQILIGSLLPLVIFYHPATADSRTWLALGAVLVIVGGFAQMYVTIVGGQAYPLAIFPGKEILSSGFYDGVVAQYTPSLWELLLGFGGVALALMIVALAVKVLRFLPVSLGDDVLALPAESEPASSEGALRAAS